MGPDTTCFFGQTENIVLNMFFEWLNVFSCRVRPLPSVMISQSLVNLMMVGLLWARMRGERTAVLHW